MKILLVIHSEVRFCPRALRLLNTHSKKHEIEIINGQVLLGKQTFISKLYNFLLMYFGFHKRYLKRLFPIQENQINLNADLVIVYDLILLDFVLNNVSFKKLAVDLREYYPTQFENNKVWNLSFAKLFKYMGNVHLQKVNYLTTVSRGIAELYNKNFNIKAKVQYSLPRYHNLSPSVVHKEKIKLVHHGVTNPNRGLEGMINVIGKLGDKYKLTLFLVNNNKYYYSYLKKTANKYSNVEILPALEFEQIIPTLNKFDIGLFCPPKATTNLDLALPNKLFEYIQARLMIIVTPLNECKRFVEKEKIGISLADFKTESLHYELLNLSRKRLIQCKKNSGNICNKYSVEPKA